MAKPSAQRPVSADSTLQTLDRGLTVLEVLAAAMHPMTLSDLASCLNLHRSIVYRLLRTLQHHHLVAHTPGGYMLGTRTNSLGRTALPIIQQAAKPEIARLAFRVGLSAFLVIRDGREAVTLVSVEVESTWLHHVYGPGVRHPLIIGAPGLAVLAGNPAVDGERQEVTRGRREGHVTTFGEVIPNQGTMAAPVYAGSEEAIGSVAITFGPERPGNKEISAVVDCARVVSGRLARAVLRGAVVPDLSTTQHEHLASDNETVPLSERARPD